MERGEETGCDGDELTVVGFKPMAVMAELGIYMTPTHTLQDFEILY
jgi:hypothetical protein